MNETGLKPETLQLEITENVEIFEDKAIVKKLEELHNKGIRIAIDDFGTGYSSLGRLREYPVDSIKIDKSFIGNMSARYDAAIIECIINLAQNLDINIVAEGVETEKQLAVLREKKCDEVQGYLFSHPLTSADFSAWLMDNATNAGHLGSVV